MKTVFILSAILAATPATVFAASPAETFKAVCESRAVKSDKLMAACAAGNMPGMLKDGSRFKAIGIGAEINALAANLHLIDGVAQ